MHLSFLALLYTFPIYPSSSLHLFPSILLVAPSFSVYPSSS
jgi:flagellar biosynthesis component FlhA